MLHSPGDQAWNDYWVPNCEIWHSAEPLVLAGQFGYWHKSGEGSGGKGGLLSRCHLFLDWWRKRSDMKMKGDRDLFTQKQRELDTGRKMEKLRLKGTWKKQRIKEWEREGRKTCRGGGGVQRLNDHLHTSLVRKNNLGNLDAAQEKLSIYLALYKLH